MEQSKLTSKLQIEKKEEVVYDKEHPLFKKRIVLTEIKGKELERFILSKGGEVGKNVSKKTFLVVKKDEMTDTEKANAAKLLGIKTITEVNFRKEYNI
jgi:NAD-dependent DNA ligase